MTFNFDDLRMPGAALDENADRIIYGCLLRYRNEIAPRLRETLAREVEPAVKEFADLLDAWVAQTRQDRTDGPAAINDNRLREALHILMAEMQLSKLNEALTMINNVFASVPDRLAARLDGAPRRGGSEVAAVLDEMVELPGMDELSFALMALRPRPERSAGGERSL